MEKLIKAVEKVILTVNDDKTKYLVVIKKIINYRHGNNTLNLKDIYLEKYRNKMSGVDHNSGKQRKIRNTVKN